MAIDGSLKAGRNVEVRAHEIVDAIGGTDPATGDLEITISEMNLDGLDDTSLGQGDTTVVEQSPRHGQPVTGTRDRDRDHGVRVTVARATRR